MLVEMVADRPDKTEEDSPPEASDRPAVLLWSEEGGWERAGGRLSSEMVVKAAKMGVPVAVSLNSPTDRAVELAERLGVALVGYARGARLSVYSHPERLEAPAGLHRA